MTRPERAFAQLIDAAVRGQTGVLSRLLATNRALATRRAEDEFFVDEATHQLYAGDTALHMAAAEFPARGCRDPDSQWRRLPCQESSRRRAAALCCRHQSPGPCGAVRDD